jgi:hypothetical protein
MSEKRKVETDETEHEEWIGPSLSDAVAPKKQRG